MEDSSEINRDILPAGIRGWSWGACFLNGFWGLGNKTYVALLAFIPIINVPVMIFLGIKGNELAWKNREWENVEQFKSAQKKWNIGGLAVFGFYIIFLLRELFAAIY